MMQVETRQRCETQTLEDYDKFCLDAQLVQLYTYATQPLISMLDSF